jgi:glucan 1,3-beta-glucosidase
MKTHQQQQQQQQEKQKQWVRGVNLGGWLVFERYITPYFFALTDCHLKGDFRYYEGQIDAPPTSSPEYKPMPMKPTDDGADSESSCAPVTKYPDDAWSMTKMFDDPAIAASYFDVHYDHFLTREDVSFLKSHGVTHFRVPLPHWILGNVEGDEPYVAGRAWAYFRRLVGWCREEGIELWPDLHTAPGSQNGFDNSGHFGGDTGRFLTCDGWFNYDPDNDPRLDRPTADDTAVDDHHHHTPPLLKGSASKESKEESISTLPSNVRRTLVIIDQITAQVKKDGLDDVVTGFGLINEPAGDCDHIDLARFYDAGRDVVRKNLGQGAHIYLGDTFQPELWNDFWAEKEPKYENTYLDTHTYHPFEPHVRALSPREQIALVCERDRAAVTSCCYHDNKPTQGIGRIFAEWSAAFDQAVGDKVINTMNNIRWTNRALTYDEEINDAKDDEGNVIEKGTEMPQKRQDFLRDFVTAQMVNYESSSTQSSGWFYWNFKMEGSYFPEWDMMRGLREGWFPTIPEPHVDSIDLYGGCYDIMKATVDDMGVIEIFPPSPPDLDEMKNPVDDDVVLTDGAYMEKDARGIWVNTNPDFIARQKIKDAEKVEKANRARADKFRMELYVMTILLAIVVVIVSLRRRYRVRKVRGARSGYKVIEDDDSDVTDETSDVRISTMSLADLGMGK